MDALMIVNPLGVRRTGNLRHSPRKPTIAIQEMWG